jgi:hypothetical protein
MNQLIKIFQNYYKETLFDSIESGALLKNKIIIKTTTTSTLDKVGPLHGSVNG